MRRKFTLVELLVVIAVIALLAGLMFPVVHRSRAQGRKTQCLSNLHQIGVSIHTYVIDYKSYLPVIPTQLPAGPKDPFWLNNVLALSKETYHCPADDQLKYDGQTYYGRWGASYGWNIMYNGMRIDDKKVFSVDLNGQNIEATNAPLMGDAEAFHGNLDKNYLYPDGRTARKLEDIFVQTLP